MHKDVVTGIPHLETRWRENRQRRTQGAPVVYESLQEGILLSPEAAHVLPLINQRKPDGAVRAGQHHAR